MHNMSLKHRNKERSTLSIGPWFFKVRIGFSIISLIAIVILVYLGTWQLGRSMTKKDILVKMQQKIHALPMPLSGIDNPHLIKNRFTPVSVIGTYLNKYTFLLDNQVFNSQVGYRVLTTMQSPYLDKWLLVDRGWIAQGSSRKELPPIKDIYGVQELNGIVNTIPTGIILHPDIYNADAEWPIVIQNLDLEFIEKHLQHSAYDFLLQLRTNDPSAYPMPPLDFGMPANKHIAYALQWYAFAIMVVVYYVLTSFSRRKE